MKFRYELDIKKSDAPINHQHQLLLIGSCFTENIGEKLNSYKFTTLQNPNGILFNPVSVAEALTAYIENKTTTADELFYNNEGWHSWRHHSRFSSPLLADALQKINGATESAHRFLKKADYVFITLGSSWVYQLAEKAAKFKAGVVAANNHKAPHDWFHRRLLSADEVMQLLDPLLYRLFLFNPKIKIIFTISPVRHLREGAIDNNRSKAVLIQAVHQLTNKFDRLYYFPAYELVIDDLRDYRFFAEDLVHPNYFATEYVWEKFVAACMSEETRALLPEIKNIMAAHQHKPFNAASEGHKKFLQSFHQKTKELQALHPYLNLNEELRFFAEEPV